MSAAKRGERSPILASIRERLLAAGDCIIILSEIVTIDGRFLCPGFAGLRHANQYLIQCRKGCVIAFQRSKGTGLNPPRIGILWVELCGNATRL